MRILLKIKIELHLQFDDLAVLRAYCLSQSIVNNEKNKQSQKDNPSKHIIPQNHIF